jgi:hypothetical protein
VRQVSESDRKHKEAEEPTKIASKNNKGAWKTTAIAVRCVTANRGSALIL